MSVLHIDDGKVYHIETQHSVQLNEIVRRILVTPFRASTTLRGSACSGK